jgi:hypothetical protein
MYKKMLEKSETGNIDHEGRRQTKQKAQHRK